MQRLPVKRANMVALARAANNRRAGKGEKVRQNRAGLRRGGQGGGAAERQVRAVVVVLMEHDEDARRRRTG